MAAKLRVLVETTAGPGDRRSLAFPGGAALHGADGTWVLADVDPARSLGPALVVARRAGAGGLQLVAEAETGLLARRASQFAQPPAVWRVEGRGLVPATATPIADPPPLDPRVAAFADVLTRAGADPVVEHGRLIGEVAGLEVARVVVDERGARLEVGVGRFDREAHEIVANGTPGEDVLRRVVAEVQAHRGAGRDTQHPLARLAAARAMRARLVAEPGLVGADHLVAMAPTVEPPDLKTPWPAAALGAGQDGEAMVVVCSVGVDLDLVPAAADARLAAFAGAPARLLLALPARDAHAVTLELAGALAAPAEVMALDLA